METPTKEKVTLFVIAIFPIGITCDINSDKSNHANQKSSHPDLGGNADFAIKSLKLVNLFLRKRHPFIYEKF